MLNKSIKSVLMIILCITIILSFYSCSKIPEENADTPDEIQDNTVYEHDNNTEDNNDDKFDNEDVVNDVGFTNPLTGEAVETDISKNRPVAIMVNNISYAMPQLGISNADIIYEMLVEGGITRMCAIYQELDESDIIGSIRSARHNYLDLVEAYDAIYVHAGGSRMADTQIVTRNIDDIDAVSGEGYLFYRDEERLATMAYEHTLCVTGEKLLNYIRNDSEFRLEHETDYKSNMIFTDNVKMPNAESALDITVHFGLGKTSEFIYNSDNSKYSMRQYDDTYIDGNTGEAVEFKNVIILQTDVQSIDSEDHKEITLTGTGKGWYACNGMISEINWSRAEKEQFEYTYSDGTSLEYGVGTTYVCVISNAGNIETN